MQFNSLEFLLFLFCTAGIYYLIPLKYRHIWLLTVSFLFYIWWNPYCALLLLSSTVLSYFCGRALVRVRSAGKKKAVLALAAILNILILSVFKYGNFIVENVKKLLGFFHVVGLEIRALDLVLPIGISFYTFKALSYCIDVYRDNKKCEKDFGQYALYISFFPQIASGPIERAGIFLGQVKIGKQKSLFTSQKFVKGICLLLWGYFQKMVIADRLVIVVNEVFRNYNDYAGLEIVIAAILLGLQIYCDFSSYSDMACGCALMLGFETMQNFKRPYLATSIQDFWRRWHISLSSWFRDYLYIPLGGNRKGTVRKYLNVLIVFLVSGLWHGAGWSFIIWGALHGVYQILGGILKPLRRKITYVFKLDQERWTYHLVQILWTTVLVDFAWIFFQASSTREAIEMIGRIFVKWNPWVLVDGSLTGMGLSGLEWGIAILALCMLALVSVIRERCSVWKWYWGQGVFVKYVLLMGIISVILIFGIYGPAYEASQFVYFQF